MLEAPVDTGMDCLTGLPNGEGGPRLTGRDARGCCPLPTAWGVTALEPVPRKAHPERMRDSPVSSTRWEEAPHVRVTASRSC